MMAFCSPAACLPLAMRDRRDRLSGPPGWLAVLPALPWPSLRPPASQEAGRARRDAGWDAAVIRCNATTHQACGRQGGLWEEGGRGAWAIRLVPSFPSIHPTGRAVRRRLDGARGPEPRRALYGVLAAIPRFSPKPAGTWGYPGTSAAAYSPPAFTSHTLYRSLCL